MAVIAKSITALTGVISVPLTLQYLGAERFGLWMTISSLASILTFADLGLGNGLVSAVSVRYGRDEGNEIAQYVSSAFFFLLFTGLMLLTIFWSVHSWVPWTRVFSVASRVAASEADPAIFAVVVCFCIGLPLVVAQRIQMAMQEFWLSNLWLTAGNLLGLAGVILAIHWRVGLPVLTLAMYGGPVIAGLLSTSVEFGLVRRALSPRWSLVSRQVISRLARTGLIFFLLQILTVLGLGIDNVVIAAMSNAEAVAPYAIMARYAQSLLVVNVFLQPLWPAFGEAMGRGDYAWARQALNRASRWTIGIGIGIAIFTAVAGQGVVRLWVGHSVTLPWELVCGVGVMILVQSYNGVVASFMNNEGLVHQQVGILFCTVVACLTLKVIFMRLWGVSGVPWATVLAFGGGYCLFGMALVRRHLAQFQSEIY